MNQEGLGDDQEGTLLLLIEHWVRYGVYVKNVQEVSALEPIEYNYDTLDSYQFKRLEMIQYIIHEMTAEGSGLNKRMEHEPKMYSSFNNAVVKPAKKIRKRIGMDYPHMETFNRLHLMPFNVESLRQVKKLKIRIWNLGQLPPFFHLFSKIKCLTVEDGDDVEIPDTILSMGSLRELNLTSWHAIRVINSSIQRLHRLEKINFHGCIMLSNITFDENGLPNLKYVNLSSTAITKIPNCILSNSSVEKLILDYCENMEFPSERISDMKSLRVLSLQKGRVERIPNIPSLEKLDLYNSKWVRRVEGFKTLKKLNLLGTNVVLPFERFECFPNMEDIRISNSDQLIQDSLTFPNLKVFHLWNYPDRSIPRFIYKCEHLEEFCLRDAYNVTEIDANLYKLKNLKYVRLVNCGLSNLPDGIAALSTLHTLDISHCSKIQILPSEIAAMNSLTMLYLNETGVINIPPEVLNMESLRYVVDASGQALKDKDRDEQVAKFQEFFLKFLIS